MEGVRLYYETRPVDPLKPQAPHPQPVGGLNLSKSLQILILHRDNQILGKQPSSNQVKSCRALLQKSCASLGIPSIPVMSVFVS